jgi:hypothetical protein
MRGGVSGAPLMTLAHGASMTLAGSGFGAKATPAPLKWDSFETGALGGRVSGANGWIKEAGGGGAGVEVYSATRTRRAGGLAAKFPLTHTLGSSIVLDNLGLTEAYLSYWVYIDRISGEENDNIKLARLANVVSGDYHEHPSVGYTRQFGNGDFFYVFRETGTPAQSFSFSDTPRCTEGAWHHFEYYCKMSSPAGAANGIARFWLDREVQHTGDGSGVVTLSAASPLTTWAHLLVGFYMHETIPGAIDLYYQDLYLDSTLQRVVLADAATWGAVTQIENQPATAWADTAITITGNHGGFAVGETRYLYVLNADGVPVDAAGTAVVLG